MAETNTTVMHRLVKRSFVRRRYARTRRAFTLVEALFAITITTVAGTAVLAGIASGIQATDAATEHAIATGIASQLIDEIGGARYVEAGVDPFQWPLGPAGSEASAGNRELFDDVDDYNGFVASPPEDVWGVRLGWDNGQGGLRHPAHRINQIVLADWQIAIDVFYVSDSDTSVSLPAGVSSNHRAVRVLVTVDDPNGGTRELANLQRVFAYVPPL